MKNAELWLNRGVVKQSLGDNLAACADYQQATKLRPELSVAHFNLGNLYLSFNQLEFAIDAYDKVR
jgi:lipoprotein NlpI